jgi:hypothetical protein
MLFQRLLLIKRQKADLCYVLQKVLKCAVEAKSQYLAALAKGTNRFVTSRDGMKLALNG